jgi:hypothetical protein
MYLELPSVGWKRVGVINLNSELSVEGRRYGEIEII